MRAIPILCAVLLAGAAPVAAQTAAPMTPAQAVAAAQAAGLDQPVAGSFEFTVGSTGAGGFVTYLNSAADYHDAGNLTAVLGPEAVNAVQVKLGAHPQDVMKGKRIRLRGEARRVQTGTYHDKPAFQTRIQIDTPDQIEILG